MRKTARWLAALALLIGVFSFSLPAAIQAEENDARLVCLNIGKADGMLLLYGDKAYLIDAGYEQTYPALETALAQYGVAHLDGVFLTHCHRDHSGGLMKLAQSEIAVDAWYAPALYYDVKAGKHPAVLAAAARGAQVTWLRAGDRIAVGEDASLTVLGPLRVDTENENNNSLVMRFDSPQGSILLAGDMKEEEESDLLRAGAFSPCDALKVGHHGDSEATTLALLRAVKPQVALILTSSLEEPDTPARQTLSRLSAVGCKTYLSQSAQDAMLLTLRGGKATVTDVCWAGVPQKSLGFTLSIHLAEDRLTLSNTADAPLSLAGCFLYSSKGEDLLPLPDITLAPGASYTVGSRSTPGEFDLKWDKKRVWHQEKRDMAILYDAYGRPLACTDNGFSE